MKKRGLIVEQVTFNKDDIKNFNTKIVSLFQIDIVANNIIILKALVEIRKIGNQPCQPNFGNAGRSFSKVPACIKNWVKIDQN
ncbi:uncharacterized protein OCT59_025202 [Rhizophagus irregularis]|uniref:uncharacterized protein n=1 Tax=Rhizophagus irregularis TaxID=588596 RepID=UPI0033201E22|nr:hypothetical protein OCT59_025202 [Rhizophagus irregularis]